MKVTAFVVIVFVITLCACKQILQVEDDLDLQQKADSIASKKIDSAYRQICRQCDSARKYRLPEMVDSLLKNDTLYRRVPSSK